MIKKRIQNISGYQKRKTLKRKKAFGDADQLGESEVEELHTLLLKEVKAKQKNLQAIKEIQQNTFTPRRRHIEQLSSEKTVVSEIVSTYPFFRAHECIVSIICYNHT